MPTVDTNAEEKPIDEMTEEEVAAAIVKAEKEKAEQAEKLRRNTAILEAETTTSHELVNAVAGVVWSEKGAGKKRLERLNSYKEQIASLPPGEARNAVIQKAQREIASSRRGSAVSGASRSSATSHPGNSLASRGRRSSPTSVHSLTGSDQTIREQ